MDRLMELTEYMVQRIKQMPDKYFLILEPECVNVSFWYIPTSLRGVPHTPEKETKLGAVSFPQRQQKTHTYFFDFYYHSYSVHLLYRLCPPCACICSIFLSLKKSRSE